MLDTIIEHVLDLLQADDRLIRGGNAWADGFLGVKRITPYGDSDGDEAAADYVNLFDTPLAPDSADARPAIYCGTQANEATDRLDFPSVSGVRVEYRVLTLPLVLVVRGATRAQARHKRNQLRANVLYILLDHLVETGYWYEQTVPGQAGGGDARQSQWESATGGAAQGVIEAGCIIPVQLRYSFSQLGDNA